MAKEVHSLYNGLLHRGDFQLEWSGQNTYGQLLPSGIYLGVLTKSGKVISKNRMILLK